jgi:hypothetical protein
MGTLPLGDGDHLVRAIGFGPQGQTLEKTAVYHLNRRRPNGPELTSPSTDAWLNTLSVTFNWKPALRVTRYRLLASTNPDPSTNPLVDQTLDANTTSYTADFSTAYQDLYWRVIASNELGSSEATRHFSIDRVAPSSSVTALAPTTFETKFTVQWGGSDDRSGVRWYDVQYRDGTRNDWTDWQVGVTQISTIFSGQSGHTYYFRARALDNAGNLEDWSPGNGDTFTTVDPAAKPPTPWWNAAYGYKRNLLILNNDGRSLPVGYPVHLRFDNGTTPAASELYNASQSSARGDDFRVIYNNQTELSRFVQTFRSDQIDIWFNLQAGIGPNPSSDGTSYQIYYGSALASNPPGSLYAVLPLPSCDSNTVGLWTFTDGNGTTATDACGRHSGPISNGAWGQGLFNQPALGWFTNRLTL